VYRIYLINIQLKCRGTSSKHTGNPNGLLTSLRFMVGRFYWSKAGEWDVDICKIMVHGCKA